MHSQTTTESDRARPAPRAFLPPADISACATYRDAVRLAWACRSNQHLTQRTLAEACGLYAPHVSEYLNDEPTNRHGKRRLDLPAHAIVAFEAVVGNHAVSQYLVRLGAMTLMEEVIHHQRHA